MSLELNKKYFSKVLSYKFLKINFKTAKKLLRKVSETFTGYLQPLSGSSVLFIVCLSNYQHLAII